MKIDITSIIIAHWQTLYDAKRDRTSYIDIFTFYAVPALVATTAFSLGLELKPDHYNVSITFFGIFLALLLNIQVAIFSIFQRKWEPLADKRQAAVQSKEMTIRRMLLSELNTNIAYLTAFSCLALLLFLIFYIFGMNSGIAPSIATFLYVHFLLTFIMIIKRSYSLFQKEYRDSPD